MKLSESLAAVGQSFPYYPKLCPVVGGVKPCVFLCVVFWRSYREHDGWVQMSMETITAETGLTPWEQRAARAALKKIGALQEKENRLAHQMFYRIDCDALDAAFEASVMPGSEETGDPEVGKANLPKLGNLTPCKEVPRKDPDKTIRSSQADKAIKFWNAQEQLPKVKCLSPGRAAKLNQRVKDTFWSENFEAAVSKMIMSDFCMGRNDRGWRAEFDWMLQPDTVTKIMEGKYDNRRAVNGNHAPMTQLQRLLHPNGHASNS